MGIEKLKRVVWLLQERHPGGVYRRKEVERAIMEICGYHPQTIKTVKAALLKVGYLRHDHYRMKLCDDFDF